METNLIHVPSSPPPEIGALSFSLDRLRLRLRLRVLPSSPMIQDDQRCKKIVNNHVRTSEWFEKESHVCSFRSETTTGAGHARGLVVRHNTCPNTTSD